MSTTLSMTVSKADFLTDLKTETMMGVGQDTSPFLNMIRVAPKMMTRKIADGCAPIRRHYQKVKAQHIRLENAIMARCKF